ncbi:MAG: hypothetical protein H7Y03_13960 [Chitinophagaceae bacterium]|nr:hypothetical protein [Chitinophagaceae bacterium]
MALIIVLIGVFLLLVLLLVFKFNAFISLLLVSFAIGVAEGMTVTDTLSAIVKGVGSTLGSLALVLSFGAMLGKMIEESGAADRITFSLISLFGKNHIQWAVLLTGFCIGMPMIYNAGFLVLIPLIYTLAASTKLPLLYLGIPMAAALSVTHGLLPPHPGPTTIAILFKADINTTLLYGILVAIPTVILAGPVFSRLIIKLEPIQESGPTEAAIHEKKSMPGLAISVLTAIVPVFLMLLAAVINFLSIKGSVVADFFNFLGDPTIALFLALMLSIYTLGIFRGRKMPDIMQSLTVSVQGITMILLIIAAGGAFKEVLIQSGVGVYVADAIRDTSLSPLLLAWLIAACLRLTLGSATVAAITAAGIVLPAIGASSVKPELMVLAITSGSLMFSHVNDIGFWMFKEYFKLSLKQTFLSWSIMETIVSVAGLIGVLLLNTLL